jgi:hypothetical protein
MKGDPRFLKKPKSFWALVRTLSQELGYTVRRKGIVSVHPVQAQAHALLELGLDPRLVIDASNRPTELGRELEAYFRYRADTLNQQVEPLLMDAEAAQKLFEKQKKSLSPKCPIPMKKQKGAKRKPAYLTALVNMLVEQAIAGVPCDYDPRQLTTITLDGKPLRTLSRRVDGAFPSAVNPIAVWEIKEYYFTTSFGSRVADGVYETLLDGLELEELHQQAGLHVEHILFVDAHYTWWKCGRSYLCRIIDMMNMGYVDEVIFGREVLTRVPVLATQWVKTHKAKSAKGRL